MIDWLRGLLRRWFTKRDYPKLKIPKPPDLEELRRLRAYHVKLITQGVYMLNENQDKISVDNTDKIKYPKCHFIVNPDFDNLDSAEFEAKQVVQRETRSY